MIGNSKKHRQKSEIATNRALTISFIDIRLFLLFASFIIHLQQASWVAGKANARSELIDCHVTRCCFSPAFVQFYFISSFMHLQFNFISILISLLSRSFARSLISFSWNQFNCEDSRERVDMLASVLYICTLCKRERGKEKKENIIIIRRWMSARARYTLIEMWELITFA